MTRPAQLDLRPLARAAVRTRAPLVSITTCAATDDCRSCADRDVCSVARLIYGPPVLRVVGDEWDCALHCDRDGECDGCPHARGER